MRGLLSLAAALALAGCAFGQEKGAAEAAVAQFHQLLDAGRYHDIFTSTSDDFRRITNEAEFTRILQLVHDRLGAVRQASEGDWRVNLANGGDMVVLHYATQFAAGHGDEEFIYRVSGGTARLAGYHVNAPGLVGPAAPGPQAGGKPGEAAPPATGNGKDAPPVVTVPTAPPPPPEPPAPTGGK